MGQKNKPNELYLTRLYDAPVKMVWEAWTDPKQVAQWWGPRGFTLTTHSSDVRTGGTWSYTMRGPDGTEFHSKTKYLEVEKYSRMIYDHGGNDDRPPLFRVTVNFTETAGKTKMEMTMALPSPEAAAETKKFIKKAGGDATWDRLAEHLSSVDTFVINRSFDAPRDVVFEMWTDPKHFSQWLPPTGFTMEYLDVDIRPGGTSFYRMTGGENNKTTMYGKANYKEITKPSRLVYTQIFCDEKGKNLAPLSNADMARNDANNGCPGGRGTGKNSCDGHVGSLRRSRGCRTGNVQESQRRHDPGMDRLLRQIRGVLKVR